MTQPRSTTKIIATAKDALAILTAEGDIVDAKARLVDQMVTIIEIATRMDARTGTVDPSPKKPAKRKAVQLPIPGTEQ